MPCAHYQTADRGLLPRPRTECRGRRRGRAAQRTRTRRRALGLRDRVQIAVHAYEHGIVRPRPQDPADLARRALELPDGTGGHGAQLGPERQGGVAGVQDYADDKVVGKPRAELAEAVEVVRPDG